MDAQKAEIIQRLNEFAKKSTGLYSRYLTAFSKKLEVTPQTMTQYLSGKTQLGQKMLERLEKLGCDIQWLMTGIPETYTQRFRRILTQDYGSVDSAAAAMGCAVGDLEKWIEDQNTVGITAQAYLRKVGINYTWIAIGEGDPHRTPEPDALEKVAPYIGKGEQKQLAALLESKSPEDKKPAVDDIGKAIIRLQMQMHDVLEWKQTVEERLGAVETTNVFDIKAITSSLPKAAATPISPEDLEYLDGQ